VGDGDIESVGRELLSKLKPGEVGLYFRPVGAEGIRAASSGTDFGQLFLGLSMFIIASSVVLTGLIFVFRIYANAAYLVVSYSLLISIVVDVCIPRFKK